MLPSVCECLVVRQDGDSPPKLVKESLGIPAPKDKQLVVRIQYAAQNPTDGTSPRDRGPGDRMLTVCSPII